LGDVDEAPEGHRHEAQAAGLSRIPLARAAGLRYNERMSSIRKCNSNQTAKWIRVIVSLGIIGAGIYYKNWVGLLGFVTLLSAFTGSCPLSLHFYGVSDIRIKRSDSDEE
jgi:hypothetical protein